MNKEELILASHEELLKLIKWINSPIIYIPVWNRVDKHIENITNGCIVVGSGKVGEGMELITGIPKESVALLLETFCQSHKKLQEK